MLRHFTIWLVSAALVGGLSSVVSAQSGWNSYEYGVSSPHHGRTHVDVDIHTPRLGIGIHSNGHGYRGHQTPHYPAFSGYGGHHGHSAWQGYRTVNPYFNQFGNSGGYGGYGFSPRPSYSSGCGW